MIDFSKIKLKGGWAMDRARFSDHARQVFEFAIPFRREGLKLGDDALWGMRFNDNGSVLARLESMFTEEEFMACPGLRIDSALTDAAQADHWYTHEKDYEWPDMPQDDCEDNEDE
jgi:hypothetical protein